jgi:aldehyde dehydrogenase (NAD+)
MWTYGASLEPSEGAKLKPSYHPFVDGEFVEDRFRGGRFVEGTAGATTLNPAADAPLAEVRSATPPDVDRAVAAARRARDGEWGRLSGAARARLLLRVAQVVAARASELAVLETLDTGRPIRLTRDADLPAVVARLFSSAGWADKLAYAGHGPTPRPAGVVGALATVGSLPAAVGLVAPALASGNAVVLDPDPDAPLTALVLAEAAAEAGLPAGVLNVLPAAATLGEHPGLDVLAVTGSPGTCRDAARRAALRARVTAQPVGQAVHVVHDDAPLDQAVDGVVDGLGTDQRILVAEPVLDDFGALLRERVAALRVGDPLDRNTDVGPVSSPERRDRAVSLVAAADDDGGRRWTSPAVLPEQGWYLAPTIVTDVAPTARLAREEITGPLLPVLTFRTPAEAVGLARGAATAAVWGEKGSRTLWTAQQLNVGIVWVNAVGRSDCALPPGADLAPFLLA